MSLANRPFVVADGYGPLRAPRVDARRVRCPSCGAEERDLCIAANGERTASSHRVRRRMAVRALNNERSAA